jgi:hypothetical protein
VADSIRLYARSPLVVSQPIIGWKVVAKVTMKLDKTELNNLETMNERTDTEESGSSVPKGAASGTNRRENASKTDKNMSCTDFSGDTSSPQQQKQQKTGESDLIVVDKTPDKIATKVLPAKDPNTLKG